MASIDADTMMICAGVLLSALAFAEVYSTWKKTRRTGPRERDSDPGSASEGPTQEGSSPNG
ncbi:MULTISPECIES: hypothetical protein [Halorubrum]|uniref:Uncharacterized protein n=1 Tax=Halorubrum sodomense TaxID=35743 RepID=A0A1I6H099_HALSD|nr:MULTISPECIES: hypothetical protein [Halorubrum]TKX53769.1 hypothetical protein EXE44_17190 [Halorubrum sp. SS7]TKX55068.1 hypothetical protein EXE42_06100 [Halorubrum sp. SP3]SFR47878.1 hypothetical protein SAMN04487937_2251 [Halorubrum sodomense]